METKIRLRNNYLDWLRVLGILFVFIYHSTRLYNVEGWQVKNDIWYPSVEVWNVIATSWMMPLMFVISGASLFYAVGKSSFGKFIKDKIMRLLVPLLVADLTHISIQYYLERKSHGVFSGNFFQYLPQYYQFREFDWQSQHLWYLIFLFIYSILLFPLMRWFKGDGQAILAKINRLLAKTGVLYLVVLPLIFLYLIFGLDSPILLDNGGYPYIMYMLYLILGFFLVSDEKLQNRIQNLRWVSLCLGLLMVAGFAYLTNTIVDKSEISLSLALAGIFRVVGGWVCILGFFGLSQQYLTRRSPVLDYGNEAVLPFYILHQTVIQTVGFFVLQWALPDPIEWAVVVIISFAAILIIYEFLIRRWNIMRILFGMKAKASHIEKRVQPKVGATAKGG